MIMTTLFINFAVTDLLKLFSSLFLLSPEKYYDAAQLLRFPFLLDTKGYAIKHLLYHDVYWVLQ